MNILDTDRNILFLRVPKCGSTYTRKHLVDKVLASRRRVVHAFQNKAVIAWQDFRLPQLEQCVGQKHLFLATEYFSPLGTTYNRFAPHWHPEQASNAAEAAALFARFKAAGWFMFTFLRNPGDLLCSMYHYGKDTPATQRWYFRHNGVTDHFFYWFDPSETLDQFLGRDPLPLPKLFFDWRQLDHCAPFSPHNYALFCTTYFNQTLYLPQPENKSSNAGYDYYCQTGMISQRNQQRIRDSEYGRIYESVAARARR